ncbi:MAG: glycosyltransferase family 39 protein [Acidobacteriia bacterium]|nr:glycosyltransferase family 39 protein [Terriglobia bacterium]
MKPPSALGTLLALAALRLLLHTVTNGQYGFHRDELATLDDARHLAWGYVAYPPVTPFLARLAMDLLGSTPAAVRFFTALAQAIAMVIAGLMARELGGGRTAQVIAAFAAAVSPVSISAGHLFQYVSFDLLWSVLAVYFVIRLLRSDDPRWWLAVGAAVGLGLMTRYTMAWLAAGLAAGFLVTPARSRLRTWWAVAGAVVTGIIVLPNLIWQATHGFISLDFLQSIHARDIAIGRTDGFLGKQLLVPAHPFTIPLWIAGLYFYFRTPEGARCRVLGWAFLVTLILFTVSHARDYYTAPLYPMLLAAGAVLAERWSRWARGFTWAGLALALPLGVAFGLPVAPVNSRWFQAETRVNGDLREEIGWPEFVETVARIRDSLPAGERATTGILTVNYGEAGAIDLYGAAYGLPPALSRVNSFWLRGYGDPPPQTLIVVGFSRAFVDAHFAACESRGTISNRFGVHNEETDSAKNLWVCRGLREPWPEFWRKIKGFG